jgi:hypothetical protein
MIMALSGTIFRWDNVKHTLEHIATVSESEIRPNPVNSSNSGWYRIADDAVERAHFGPVDLRR